MGFPDTRLAETDPNGLLAIGGDLSTGRLLQAYRHGIFPWFSHNQPILWWSPAPRMVLFPDELHVSRSLRKSLRTRGYEVSVDQAFEATIRACAAPREQTAGTWLLPEMIVSYKALHESGIAHSVEVWFDDALVGGLYGIALGEIFFGESMFSWRTDASKTALVLLAQIALEHPFRLIDCQVYTPHLSSLGAREVDRDTFEGYLQDSVDRNTPPLPAQPRGAAARLLDRL
ncbi:MAG: leucyl/phenylalanyl-tRNA--protein transferase [Gammaproteobacteria bacterium]|nr:leucyl/phenylalanyl-tRNA--protein transferase [Gammaproteobacteria bacterium]